MTMTTQRTERPKIVACPTKHNSNKYKSMYIHLCFLFLRLVNFTGCRQRFKWKCFCRFRVFCFAFLFPLYLKPLCEYLHRALHLLLLLLLLFVPPLSFSTSAKKRKENIELIWYAKTPTSRQLHCLFAPHDG